MVIRVTHKNKGTNVAAIAATATLVLEDIVAAEKNFNLPHNTLFLGNNSSDCTLYIFLDDFSDVEAPDFILFPLSGIAIELDDGETWHTLFITNTHATIEVAINEFKFNIKTVKDV